MSKSLFGAFDGFSTGAGRMRVIAIMLGCLLGLPAVGLAQQDSARVLDFAAADKAIRANHSFITMAGVRLLDTTKPLSELMAHPAVSITGRADEKVKSLVDTLEKLELTDPKDDDIICPFRPGYAILLTTGKTEWTRILVCFECNVIEVAAAKATEGELTEPAPTPGVRGKWIGTHNVDKARLYSYVPIPKANETDVDQFLARFDKAETDFEGAVRRAAQSLGVSRP